MGKKKETGGLGKAVIKNRFGGGRKVDKESHVSRRSFLEPRTFRSYFWTLHRSRSTTSSVLVISTYYIMLL